MLSKEYKTIMLENQTSELQENDGRENKAIENVCYLESEHDVITGWTASDKKYFLMKHRFGSPKVLCRSAKQRNKYLLRCKINRSLNFDLNFSRKNHVHRLSPNSSLDNSCFSMNKPSRDLSRSAKIMRALSSNTSFSHRNESIKKSLKFESSPKKTNSSDDSTSVDSIVNTPLHTPDKSLELDRNSTDTSTTSSIPTTSLESIDENQNRTPQQNRKVAKILSDTSDTKRSADRSESSGSTSLLRSNMKERIDSITRNARTPDFQCLKQGERLKTSSYDIAASTPRNLFKEFNNDEEDSPHTPENVMQFIPEGMSSIKKSHKKERSYCIGRKALKVDDPVKNVNLCAKRTMESLETDDIPTSSSYVAAVKESPKKSRNVKKALVYNLDDESSDNESISNDAGQKIMPKNIDSSDCEMCEENIQNIHDTPPSTSSTSNHDEKENGSCWQEASSDINLAEPVNRVISCHKHMATLYYSIQRNTYRLFATESSSNLKCKELCTVKSPHEKCTEMTAAKSTETLNTSNIDLDLILSRIRPHRSRLACESHAFENERPITPENINSSRLLLSQYKSIKKSHKKDKRKNKSISSTSKYEQTSIKWQNMDNEHKSTSSLNLLNFELPKDDTKYIKYPYLPPLLPLDKSNQKRKRFMSTSLQSDKHELAKSLFSKCPNMKDEFKIYTPIRKMSPTFSCAIKKYMDYKVHVCRGKMSPEKNNEATEVADTTDENGRLTPINMSTAELLCNIDSIKKSHKKDKHDGSICKKRILEKKLSEYIKEPGDTSVADCVAETSKDHTTPSLKLDSNRDDSCDQTCVGACSNMRNEDNKKNNEGNIYDPQPSTSRESSIMESKKHMKKSKPLNTTPPNSSSTLKFMKLLHATSIKKSHKKERDLNAQSKYILMNHEYDLSDDGSIFDEEDKLTYVESSSPCQYNKN